MTSLADKAAEYARDIAAGAHGHQRLELVLTRAFMAGAMAAAATHHMTRDEILAECVAFGRVVGTLAERASA